MSYVSDRNSGSSTGGGVVIGTGDKHYLHTQVIAADVWLVVHGLGKTPSVTVLDTTGKRVFMAEEHLDLNTTRLTALAPVAGTAAFN